MKNKNLQHFVGKPCTLFTHAINRDFKEENPNTFPEQPHHYFVGIVEEVDDFGILVTQVLSGLKSYFFFAGLIAIVEEAVLDPEIEEDAKVIEEIKSQNQIAIDNKLKSKEKFVNVDEITNMVKNLKENNK